MDGECVGAAIDDHDVFGIRSDAGLNWLGKRVGAAVDLAGSCVDGDKLIGIGRSRVGAVAFGRKVDRKGISTNRNARDLAGVRVEDEDEVTGSRSAPDFVAGRLLSEVGDRRAYVEPVDSLEACEVDDG